MAVLLIFAVLAALAVRMSSNHALLIAQSRNHFEADLALNYALGAEDLARVALQQDFKDSPDIDHLGEVWAQSIPPFEVDEGGYVEVQVSDLNGCFNLNAVVDNAARQILERMLLNAGVPDAIRISYLVQDWVDANSDVDHVTSAESRDYEVADPPYRSADQPIYDLSEIHLLADLETEQIHQLRALTCVIADDASNVYNINTAPIELIAALQSGVTPTDLAGLEEESRAFADPNELTSAYPVLAPAAPLMGVKSQYFRIDVHAQVGEAVTILSSLAYREPTNGQVAIMQRNFGRDFTSRLALAASTDE